MAHFHKGSGMSRAILFLALVALLFISVTAEHKSAVQTETETETESTTETEIPTPAIISRRPHTRGEPSNAVHPQAGDNVSKILPYATIVNKLPKKASTKPARHSLNVVHTLPPGFEEYVTHDIQPEQDFVHRVKSIGEPKIAFRYHLQRKQLPVLPETKNSHDSKNNIDDPMFYHKHIFEEEKVPTKEENAKLKLKKPWIMPACCGKPVVQIKKRRHINTLTPEHRFITSEQRNAFFPAEPEYRETATAPANPLLKPLPIPKNYRV